MFYEFDQNNSGGHFIVDDKVCHRLFIEADSQTEAIVKAEELGCYWGGVDSGIDCPCCGDRWYGCDEVDIEKYSTEGYAVVVYGNVYKNAEQRWHEKYGDYEIAEPPAWRKVFDITQYAGRIKFRTIEEYAQFLANEYGWTVPDARIYYRDGTVKEIYTVKDKR